MQSKLVCELKGDENTLGYTTRTSSGKKIFGISIYHESKIENVSPCYDILRSFHLMDVIICEGIRGNVM